MWKSVVGFWIVTSVTVTLLSDAAIYLAERPGKIYVGENVTISWVFDDEADMYNVDWFFTNQSSVKVNIMSWASGNSAIPNNFNIKHITNGKVYLTNVQLNNTGTYSCSVTYTLLSGLPAITETASLTVSELPISGCDCVCTVIIIPCSIAVTLKSLKIILTIVWIFVRPKRKPIVVWKFTKHDIAVIVLVSVLAAYSLIAGSVGAAKYRGQDDCCHTNTDCDSVLELCIASMVLPGGSVVVLVAFTLRLHGVFGERFSCSVLPVCQNTEQRGPPDGKPANPAVKEKKREMKLQIHKEQTQQHHKESEVHKGKPSGEKHEEVPKGRPLPHPSGNHRDDTGSAGAVSRQDVHLDRRPMPEIPSDRHKRGLSANFHDERDAQLDDNILHTLPVVSKPKTALDPMDTEGQSKKKKKKKKDRDTSRSEDIEEDNE